MVGIVLVSHSRMLAEGLMALIQQMANPDLPIRIAAGAGEDHLEIGTDAIEIMEAIQDVYSEEGVLVLMDLGSAILSAETARDLLPPEMAEKVHFCPAPLVEGAMAAAVQAGVGADLKTVCEEARSALLPKLDQLGVPVTEAARIPAIAAVEQEIILTLRNVHGLHARPAARFVQAAGAYEADVRVRNLTNGKGPVSARSLNGVATLAAVGGHQIAISASGPEAALAIKSLQELVDAGFGEPEVEEALAPAFAMPKQPVMQAPAAPAGGGQAVIPIAEGFALGPLMVYKPVAPPVSSEPATDIEAELARLEAALAATAETIRQQKIQVRASAGEEQAAIFDAHRLILQDPETLAEVRNRIRSGQNAAHSWSEVAEQTAASYRALPDPYLQQRGADVLDVSRQVLFALAGKQAGMIELSSPVILLAQDITPTETSQLDMEKVLGLATVGGGPTSHSAILARALGIPAVSGITPALLSQPDKTLLGLDGSNGQLWINPSPEVQANLADRRAAWLERSQELLRTSQAQAYTADGTRIEVVANVGSLQDAQAALKNGAEGVGLLRTEFLFLTRQTPPSEAEQTQVLSDIGSRMAPRPVIVRTLDAGGDKELPYAGLAAEANPFLGVRAIRVSLLKPELFQPQLRAILRAGLEANFRIMFPMVANLDEVQRAKQALSQAHNDLTLEKIPHCWPVETGIMVEIPSAALLATTLAGEVDFFSIGTNDLTQYTLAAERGNPALAGLADALHPAVLKLIRKVCKAAESHGKWVGVCGELAGDPVATAVLVGLGVRELSMTASSIPRIKRLLSHLELSSAQALAQELLGLPDAPSVRKQAVEFASQLEREN